MIKLKGRKVPKKKRKLAKAVKRKGSSLRGLMNSMMIKGLGRGSRRDLTVRFAMIMRPRIMKAAIRMDQAKSTRGMRRSIMMLERISVRYEIFKDLASKVETYGITTPPNDDPEDMIPKANALLLKNHVATELFAE